MALKTTLAAILLTLTSCTATREPLKVIEPADNYKYTEPQEVSTSTINNAHFGMLVHLANQKMLNFAAYDPDGIDLFIIEYKINGEQYKLFSTTTQEKPPFDKIAVISVNDLHDKAPIGKKIPVHMSVKDKNGFTQRFSSHYHRPDESNQYISDQQHYTSISDLITNSE